MILHWIKQGWWSAWSAWERLSVRNRGGLATGRASWGRIHQLARARQFWRKQEACRNPEESKGIQRNPEESSGNTGIPVPQEFLQKNSCKSGWKQEFSRPLQNHFPVNKFHQKKNRNPQESCFFLFFSPPNKFQSNSIYQPRHCLLTYYVVIHWRLVSWAILYNFWLKADLLAGQVLHKRDFNITHPVCDEGAIGSAPRLWGTTRFTTEMRLLDPFFIKRRSPLDPESGRKDPHCLIFDI